MHIYSPENALSNPPFPPFSKGGELSPPLKKGLGSRCCEALQREGGDFHAPL